MKFSRFPLFFIILIYLVACGGSSNNSSNEPSSGDFIIEPGNITSVRESTNGVLSIPIVPADEYTTEWKQASGPLTFYTIKNKNTLEYIAPNLSEDQRVIFSVKINQTNNSSKTTHFAVDVKNRQVSPLGSLPAPNVFSNANYRKHTNNNQTLDQDGIPLFIQDGTRYYYPVSIAAYAYDLYHNYYKNGDDKVLEKFLTVAAWLKDNCIYTEYGFCSYRAHFPFPAYKLTENWTTAMGQGQAISSLIAAHYLTGDTSYGQVAYDAISAYLYPVSTKGLAADFNGYTWYEEYGSEEMPAHVLNGFLFSLSGVRSFIKSYNENYAKQVFNTGVESLKENIGLYDLYFTSRYDYSPLNQLASTKTGPDSYHELHIFQLAWLYKATGETGIRDYAHAFLKQDMAGIQTVPVYREKSKEILTIEASHSIESINFGTDKLNDANWTWKNYWSTNRFPASLTLTINEDILDTGLLEKIIITSITKDSFPISFDLYETSPSGDEKLIKSDISLDNTPVKEYSHDTGNHLSYTVVFDLNVPISSTKLIVKFSGSNAGIIQLREFDIQYPRELLMEDVIERYADNF